MSKGQSAGQEPEPELPEYLGDGLYCRFDGWHVILFASNGLQTTNTVYLEPEVLRAFEQYVERLRKTVNKGSLPHA